MWGRSTKQRKSAQRRRRAVTHVQLMRTQQEAARQRRATMTHMKRAKRLNEVKKQVIR